MVNTVNAKIDRSSWDARLNKIIKGIDDLSPVLKVIAQSWFKSNESLIRPSNNTNRFEDLKEKYKRRKEKEVGFVYPIMYKRGDLINSLTRPTNVNAISKIINKKTLILGTKVPYAIYHQKGGSIIPRRPIVILNPKNEEERKAVSNQRNRAEAILNQLEEYVRGLTK